MARFALSPALSSISERGVCVSSYYFEIEATRPQESKLSVIVFFPRHDRPPLFVNYKRTTCSSQVA